MTVNKKPNVLDKIPPKGRKDAASPGTNASANAANNNVTSSFVSGITVNIFFFLYILKIILKSYTEQRRFWQSNKSFVYSI